MSDHCCVIAEVDTNEVLKEKDHYYGFSLLMSSLRPKHLAIFLLFVEEASDYLAKILLAKDVSLSIELAVIASL